MMLSFKKIKTLYKLMKCFFSFSYWKYLEFNIVLEQIKIVSLDSLAVVIITAYFIGLIFSLQIVKEFLYLNAIHVIGSILTLAFLRELSPVLTAIIFIGRIGSYFTAELATMKITEQIDALYILGINPLIYLIYPRVIACVISLPILNIFFFVTSLASSSFISFVFYSVEPSVFFFSSFSVLSILDIFKSLIKAIIFGFFISCISCIWGINTKGGSKDVGKSTTSAIVTTLLITFILDFILSYYMFDNINHSFNIL